MQQDQLAGCRTFVQSFVHRFFDGRPTHRACTQTKQRKQHVDGSPAPTVHGNQYKGHEDSPKSTTSRTKTKSFSPKPSTEGLSSQRVEDLEDILHEKSSQRTHHHQSTEGKAQVAYSSSQEEVCQRFLTTELWMIDQIERKKQAGDFTEYSQEVVFELKRRGFTSQMEGFNDQLTVKTEIYDYPTERKRKRYLQIGFIEQNAERLMILLIFFHLKLRQNLLLLVFSEPQRGIIVIPLQHDVQNLKGLIIALMGHQVSWRFFQNIERTQQNQTVGKTAAHHHKFPVGFCQIGFKEEISKDNCVQFTERYAEVDEKNTFSSVFFRRNLGKHTRGYGYSETKRIPIQKTKKQHHVQTFSQIKQQTDANLHTSAPSNQSPATVNVSQHPTGERS